MADNAWSTSTCRPDVMWYGIPGAGCHYWSQRFGQYWVGGGLYQTYAAAGFECGNLGPPVKAYQWLSEFGAFGMWFENGAIYFSGGRWRVALGSFGQTANRLVSVTELPPAKAEMPPDPPGDVADQQPPVVATWVEKRLATDERFTP